MQAYNGKYRKQPHKRKYIKTGIVGTSAQNSRNQTGTVLRSAGQLKVRSGAGTNYTEIGRLHGGDTVTIYEQQNANGMTWRNIGYGWVSMDYIVFGVDNSQAPTTPLQSTVNPPAQNTFNKRQTCIGDWVSADGCFNMTLTSNGNGVDIYITFRIIANTKSVTSTWKMVGTFDEYDTIQYSHGVRRAITTVRCLREACCILSDRPR